VSDPAVHGNFIGGEWTTAGDTLENRNPSDLDDVIGHYAGARASDVTDAVAAAQAALPHWAGAELETRQAVLDRIGTELIQRKDEIGRLLSREEGKTLPEGVGEVARAGQFFRYYGAEVLRNFGELAPSVRPGIEVEVRREPIGVVGLITPWNFPAAIPAWKIAPALAYGNTVVFKPAELVPGTAWALAEIISRSGIPDGAFNMVMGYGATVGDALLGDDRVAGISFTGSVATGQHVAKRCAEGFKKVQLELGGKNPLVVLDDADVETAAAAALNGAYSGSGQKCTASERLIVTEGIHDRFVEALTAKLQDYKVGHALAEDSKMGPLVDERQVEKSLGYVELGQQEGAELVFGGQRLNRETRGHYVAPALFTGTHNDMRINREEMFGPVAAVQRVKDYDEALAKANDTTFGLTSGICTTSLKHATHFKQNSAAGIATVNLPTGGMDYHVPFGGKKMSSYGPREQGQHARDFYTVTKTTYTKV
jgi:aldehyde dehydrogenase (NAD+)